MASSPFHFSAVAIEFTPSTTQPPSPPPTHPSTTRASTPEASPFDPDRMAIAGAVMDRLYLRYPHPSHTCAYISCGWCRFRCERLALMKWQFHAAPSAYRRGDLVFIHNEVEPRTGDLGRFELWTTYKKQWKMRQAQRHRTVEAETEMVYGLPTPSPSPWNSLKSVATTDNTEAPAAADAPQKQFSPKRRDPDALAITRSEKLEKRRQQFSQRIGAWAVVGETAQTVCNRCATSTLAGTWLLIQAAEVDCNGGQMWLCGECLGGFAAGRKDGEVADEGRSGGGGGC